MEKVYTKEISDINTPIWNIIWPNVEPQVVREVGRILWEYEGCAPRIKRSIDEILKHDVKWKLS